MTVFKDYAYYYDLLYQDKDYKSEVEYLDKIITKSGINILELGSGTGKHAQLLAQKGYNVSGVDFSQEMVDQAKIRVKEKKDNKKTNKTGKLDFFQGDIRDLNLNKNFDVVISLFHVFSYLILNKDLNKAFNVVNKHLKINGLFIFDCWYGPTVLTNLPETRIKRFEDKNILVTRIAEPIIYPNDNIVDVNYQMIVLDKKTNNSKSFKETHKMRYFFKPELELFFEKNNLELINFEEFLTGKQAGFNSWGTCFICRRIK